MDLRNLLTEILLLIFFLEQKFLVTLVISVNFLFVFTLLYLKLLLVQTSQMLNLLVTLQLDLILLNLDLAAQAIVMSFLLANCLFKLIDLVLIGLKFIFILLFVSVLMHLNVILEALNLGLKVITTLLFY